MTKLVAQPNFSTLEGLIRTVRRERIILDSDLAKLYGTETKVLVQAIKRNFNRFPRDFMFQLTRGEFDSLRSQIVTSKGRGGRRHLPYAFTEHGVIMAANILNSERAVQVSVHIVRAFVQLRQMQLASSELRDKVDALEKKYDGQFKVVFMAIRKLMSPPLTKTRQIGFRSKTSKK